MKEIDNLCHTLLRDVLEGRRPRQLRLFMRLHIAAFAAVVLATFPSLAYSGDGKPTAHVVLAATGNFGPQTLALINSYRKSRGLSPLVPNGTLQALARQHSRYQATRNRLSHDGFRQRSAAARAAGISIVCAENVGQKYRSAQSLFAGWKNSPGHRRNLLRPKLRYAGVSVVGDFATFFACE
ncbi:CAP domain-containing protein [Mesorhizobium sp. YM1C-6-2]|uniref:CAP domain-containing protein n=1 Tax=Mesorhizobium sp. YM1C-6-2 TaxID=1827501 RepID=UPI001FE034DE|nr:CAP domain-containing protein [Mesorhizobium sp. YM1C-6-2]